ncbi:HD domain-containing phosphohydrolase [Pseudomonas sp. TCU-HL1]|uniref:HD domain-containing phosphohydrolase n=1 Tax=Pseudomonas sp. TCU-HL1 TaxID=1856685 RepID=UPI00083D4469|nr:HD domain-containing phosphohydrolase [Pseudomonas sp. TCU-HL1]AOE83126.1 transcriptional regulator [Pseudomonas sp. TCU-HL1]
MTNAPPTPRQATLLLVDDEPNILRSLSRVLRDEPYRLLTAQDATSALSTLEGASIDLVLSDVRMPGMDGAALLAEVHRRWPECLRLMLTGFADQATTIRAINQGQVYRYISKPWNDNELRAILRQALAHQYAERERQRLLHVTQQQNRHLQALNATLEQRVRDRTTELQQTADMLDLAYAELRRSYVTATEVFSALLNQRLPADKQSNTRVIALVRAFSERLHLSEAQTLDLTMAAALYNLGKLGWSDTLLNRPADLLYKEELRRYRQYPELSESLLMTLEPLQGAARLIRHHQERWNGTGFPEHLKGEAIPEGSRMLKLAVDFIELQCGLVLERCLSRNEALQLLDRYTGRLYDPNLCKTFRELCIDQAPDVGIQEPGIVAVDTRRLEPGMILARNLNAKSGLLLLNEGKQLSAALIDKLIAFEASEDARYVLYVQPPSTTPDCTEEVLR